ncbi:MAG: M23 family metallopeptidase [Verrucomicrobiaceae bacterium]|nr:M23 family metallopeptidase [Verrucomicrobiaceae bacterium]
MPVLFPPSTARFLCCALSFALAVLCAPQQASAQAGTTIRLRLADGFDFPVGKPNADGYYKARGYWPNGHLGEDWNGNGGGDSDSGDPIYSIGRGVVIFSQNIYKGWGNCILVRHVFREKDGRIAMVDSLYAHLLQRLVNLHDLVEKGQLVGTMGGNSGQYPVHLHLEVRHNLHVGMNRMQFPRDNSVYYSPTAFINARRSLATDTRLYDVPVNNFAKYGGSSYDDRSDSNSDVKVPSFSGKPLTPPTEVRKPQMLNPEDDDFWSRLRAKIKGGKVTPGDEKK